MPDVSLARLYLLRAAYLLIVVGLGATIWPLILDPPPDLEHMRGVVWSLLTGVSLLALLGLRYPLQMLPLLLFELVWKTVWMLAVGLPRWSAGTADAGIQGSLVDCAVGVILFPFLIPWGYVWTHYVRRPGDRWRRAAAAPPPPSHPATPVRTLLTIGAVLLLAAGPAGAQPDPEDADPLIESVRDGNAYVRAMMLAAAEQMDEADYAFRPTPAVRSFGELLAHVTATNHTFCAAAMGEAPAAGPEPDETGRDSLRAALAASFDVCDAAFVAASRSPEARVSLMGSERSPMAVLNFRNYHALLHYGNVVTYMRLRGRVPPSSQGMEPR